MDAEHFLGTFIFLAIIIVYVMAVDVLHNQLQCFYRENLSLTVDHVFQLGYIS